MDIEALAKAAGSEAWDIWRDKRGALCISLDGVSLTEELEKFAELIASSEREACAKLCEGMAEGVWDRDRDIVLAEVAAAIRMLSAG
jgi:hypothetical protein